MKAIINIAVILLIASVATAQQNNMPPQRPADFTVTYHYDGGMSYHFKDIVINSDSCVYSVNHKGSIGSRTTKLTAEQLDDLYNVFIQNNFSSISGRVDSHVYDRGGITIKITWNNAEQALTVSNSQHSFVADNYMSAWKIICTYLENIAT